MNSRRSFWFSSLMILFAAGIFCFPRIINYPRPESPERFHQHRGDGASDVVAINSYYYWNLHGFFENGALPCVDNISEIASHRLGYTHYPPLPYWLSAGLLHVFDAKAHFITALQWTRVFTFLMNVLLAGWAVQLLCSDLELPLWSMALIAIYIGSCRGFWLYADTLIGHGTANSLMGLLLAIVLTQNADRPIMDLGKAAWIYAATTFFALWVDWETAPAACLFPMVLWIGAKPHAEMPAVRRLLWAAFLASIAALALRLVQNTAGLGGFSVALHDWKSSAGQRSFDASHQITDYTFFSWRFAGKYILTMLGRQRYMMWKFGLGIVITYLLLAARRRDWEGLKLWVAIYFISLSWNVIMPQHSFIHAYTTRYAIWPAAMALAFLLQWLNQGTVTGLAPTSRSS